MHYPRSPESCRDANGLGQTVQAGGAVVLEILAGVEHIKPPNPKRDSRGKDEYAWIQAPTNRDPRGRWGEAECQAKHEVRPACDALHIAVSKQHNQHQWRKIERET